MTTAEQALEETLQAKATLKAINRHVNKARYFHGGRQYGVDFATWSVTCPQMAAAFIAAARVITGRTGRYMPKFK